MTKWIAALAALSFITAPAAAEISRASAPVEEVDSLSGGIGIAWILAALMVVAAIVILSDEDDERPLSP
jgi:hypothetical protein